MARHTGSDGGGAWTGFLIIAFGVVGLVGCMAIYAAQIPFERALARNAALDQALAMAGPTDASLSSAALRAALGDSADRVLKGQGDLPTRVTAERARMLAAFGQDARDTGVRLRLVLAAFTAMGAVFGAVVLGIVRRSKAN